MNLPGFSAEASLFTAEPSPSNTSENYASLLRPKGPLPASLLPTVQMAILPGHEDPGVWGTKCQPCKGGWQWCVKTLDGQAIDGTDFKRACTIPPPPSGGGSGSDGNQKECRLKCHAENAFCLAACTATGFPGVIICAAACEYKFYTCWTSC